MATEEFERVESSDNTDQAEWTTTLPATNWRPPRAGSALAVLIVAISCWLLADAVGILDSVAVAAAGGAGSAGVVWLVGRERFETATTLLAVAFAPLAGGLLFVGLAYVTIGQLAGFAPQGAIFIGFGIALAAFGATSIPDDSADGKRINAAARSSFFGALLLAAVAAGLVGNIVRKEEETGALSELPLPEELPSLAPESAELLGVPPLGSFLLRTSLALLALRGALTALPVAELLDNRAGDNDALIEWFDRFTAALRFAVVGIVTGIVLLATRVLLGSAYVELWAGLPGGVIGLLDVLATSELLRWLALRVLVVGASVVLLVRLVRRLHQHGIRNHLGKIAVIGGVALAVGAGWFGHELILSAVLTRLEESLPPTVAEMVLEQAQSVIDYYSGSVIAVSLVAIGGVVSAFALGVLRLGTLLGIVPQRHSGHGVAAAGLLVTGGLGAALDAPNLYALGTIVGAVVVWDLGRFGVSLGEDVGRRAPSLPVQFVRVLTASIIGGVTATLGLVAVSMTDSVSLTTESTAALALFAAIGVAFLASLVLAR